MLLIEMTDTRTGTLIQYQFMATNYSKTAIYPTNKKKLIKVYPKKNFKTRVFIACLNPKCKKKQQ